MQTDWIKHLKTEDEKTRFIKNVKSASSVLERLTELLAEQEKDLDVSELDIRTFETPNWAYKQAYQNGARASIRKIKKLINLDQQNTESK